MKLFPAGVMALMAITATISIVTLAVDLRTALTDLRRR